MLVQERKKLLLEICAMRTCVSVDHLKLYTGETAPAVVPCGHAFQLTI